jgi:hypothetical protein
MGVVAGFACGRDPARIPAGQGCLLVAKRYYYSYFMNTIFSRAFHHIFEIRDLPLYLSPPSLSHINNNKKKKWRKKISLDDNNLPR